MLDNLPADGQPWNSATSEISMTYPIEWTRSESGKLVFEGNGLRCAINPHRSGVFYVMLRDKETTELLEVKGPIPDDSTARSIADGMIRSAIEND